jgi:hypothetical protein
MFWVSQDLNKEKSLFLNSFASSSVSVENLVSNIKGGTQTESF